MEAGGNAGLFAGPARRERAWFLKEARQRPSTSLRTNGADECERPPNLDLPGMALFGTVTISLILLAATVPTTLASLPRYCKGAAVLDACLRW
jgi:hypothetical protein